MRKTDVNVDVSIFIQVKVNLKHTNILSDPNDDVLEYCKYFLPNPSVVFILQLDQIYMHMCVRTFSSTSVCTSSESRSVW